DDDPDAAPTDRIAEGEGQEDAKRPRPGAADELHECGQPAANPPRRILGDIGIAQRLLGAEPDPGNEAKDKQPVITRVETDARDRRQRRAERRQAEEEEVELIARLPAEPVGELALAERADEEAGHR